jgi:drug/metabolite transporter (DMT)-like permease
VSLPANTLAVFSSAAYGAADFLGGLASRRGSTIPSVVVFSQTAGLLLVLAALPFLPSATPSFPDLAWGGASGVAGGVGLALLYRGLATGTMSVVAPVTAVCAVIVPVAAGVALGERPTPIASSGILLAVLAIGLISRSGEVEEGKRAAAGVSIAIASGVAIGIFLVCLERTGPAAGLWPLVPARVASVSMFAVAGALARQRLVPRRGSWPIVFGGGTLDMTANILYLLAVRAGELSIVATLASLYPASTILLARLVLGERLRRLQQLGFVCAVTAIVLIVSGASR